METAMFLLVIKAGIGIGAGLFGVFLTLGGYGAKT